VDYVDGDLTLNGSGSGYGILVVTGTLTMDGNFTWYGLVLVVGDGAMHFNGGGNGKIVGMLVDAKIWDNHTTKNLLSTVGSPSFLGNECGVNSVNYDHCRPQTLFNATPFNPPPTTQPLKVLTFRILPY